MENDNGKKNLRRGFTTGSCAAVTAKAALIMLLTGENIYNASIVTPKGLVYNAEILDVKRNGDYVSCAVIKDGGDDPDITSGTLIYASVRLLDNDEIRIKGGKGVGTVTKPGLDQPIGEAAINSVPREMIKENVRTVLSEYGITDKGVEINIIVPEGEKLAEKTFNPKLGIVGGISILGTTGIVEPMSDAAILETIKVEIRVKKAEGKKVLLVAPGNYGLTFLKEKYGTNEDEAVLCSNFVYDTVKIAADEGFTKMLFVGHIGKLVKVAGGIKNTHSMYGDHRIEILSEIASEFVSLQKQRTITDKLMKCVMTDEAVNILKSVGIGDKVFRRMAEKIKAVMEQFSEDKITTEVIVFSNEYTELVSTENAKAYLDKETGL
ncbi:cobalt-precorrin-5B (C(1))-methyltransferase CbiD [Butyrivibrio sp. JL13D10]|uniref:cobalt-precorrin-5B (C(1))-methyltransferase CbiD n=1 Tax=Butyrivibrio sp. JL13D10 TaxID=3236815 RepID=UPI0038B5129C